MWHHKIGEKTENSTGEVSGVLHHVVNTINAAVEDSWTCLSLKLVVNIFWLSCYFFWNEVFPFSCLLILKFSHLNRGASASWAKLQVGRICKYFGKYIQTLFVSLVCFEGLGLLFPFLFPVCWNVVGYGNCDNIVFGSSLNSIQIDISSN